MENEEELIQRELDVLGKTLVTDDDDDDDEIHASLVTLVLAESRGDAEAFGNYEISSADRIYAENSLMDQILVTADEEEKMSLLEIFIDEFIEEDNVTATASSSVTTTTTIREKAKEARELDDIVESLVYDLLEEEEEVEKGKALIMRKVVNVSLNQQKPYTPPQRITPPLPKKASVVIEAAMEKVQFGEEKKILLRRVVDEFIATGMRMEILSLSIEESPAEVLLSVELRQYAFFNQGGEKHMVKKFLNESSLVIRFQRPLRRNNPNLFIDIIVKFPSPLKDTHAED